MKVMDVNNSCKKRRVNIVEMIAKNQDISADVDGEALQECYRTVTHVPEDFLSPAQILKVQELIREWDVQYVCK